ncbi:MAG: hypothetical protein ACJAWZ_004032 [Paracoccaceae bacterium]
MSNQGRTVRMFLVDGNPTGIVTAEIMNWTGHVLSAPRSKLPDVLRRDETRRTGVYILAGEPDDTSGLAKVYIGESDSVGGRVKDHSKSDAKNFFERLFLITSKDQNLTKAHVRYLENRLTEIARVLGACEIVNVNKPTQGILPESDIADMEFFISQVRIILPVLGFSAMKILPKRSSSPDAPLGPKLENDGLALKLANQRNGLVAEAFQQDGDFVVLEGSLANAQTTKSFINGLPLRNKLIAAKAITPSDDPNFFRFSRDVSFTSPSAAADTVCGRSCNGRTGWLLKFTGQTLKDYQDSQADAASPSPPQKDLP